MTWPLRTLLVLAALLWADGLAGDQLAGDAPALLALALLAGLAGRRARAVPLAGTCVATTGFLVLADQAGAPGKFSAPNDAVFYTVAVAGPALAGWLLGRRQEQVASLRRQTRALERRRAELVRASRVAEVERIEREVDRALAGRVVRIIAGVREASALSMTLPDVVPARLHEVEVTARSALEDLRSVLGVLRASPVVTAPASSPPTDPPRSPRWGWVDVMVSLAGLPLAVETAGQSHGQVWANIGLAALEGPALCLVRRHALRGTLPLLLVALVQTAFFAPLPPTVSWFVPGLLLAYLVGFGLPRRTAPAGLVLVLLEVTAITIATPAHLRSLSSFLPSVLVGLLAFAAGRMVRSSELRATQLRSVLNELSRTQDVQMRLAAAEQRAEMARELHDVGAHTLTVVCLQAGAVQAVWDTDPGQARAALTGMVDLADQALSQLLLSLDDLSVRASDQPLDAAALDLLAGIGRVLGLAVTVETTGAARPLQAQQSLAAFRVVQEALTNVARHAPGAQVLVSLEYAGDLIDLRVRDSGRTSDGSSPASGSLPGAGRGLTGMRERVLALHGSLDVGPTDVGFLVHARLPLLDAEPT